MKIVFVFLIVWAAGEDPARGDVPTVSFAPVTDNLEVCEKTIPAAIEALRAKGTNAYGFCKEIEAGAVS